MNAALPLAFPARRRATFIDILAAILITLRGLMLPEGSIPR